MPATAMSPIPADSGTFPVKRSLKNVGALSLESVTVTTTDVCAVLLFGTVGVAGFTAIACKHVLI